MRYNGYLRILHDVDVNLFKVYLSDTSQRLFDAFKDAHLNDGWICPKCSKYLATGESKWKCSRCLFFYHNVCAMGQAIDNGDGTMYLLCLSCSFTT